MAVLTVVPWLTATPAPAAVRHKQWDPLPVAPVRLSRPAVMITPGANVPNPFVTKFKGRYLMFASQEIVFIPVTLMVSTSLTKWGKKLLDPFPNLPRWAQTNFTWSPDVREVDGHYLMWFSAARAGNSAAPTKCIGVASARSVFGPYTSHARGPLVCQLSHHGS
ncbi:MAG: family 43 glycosylhydrolase, partial [Nitrososphaerales archaeon]